MTTTYVDPVVDNSEAMAEGGGCIIVSWLGIMKDYVCNPYRTSLYPDRSVIVKGTFGGASITMQGDNSKALTDVDYQTLEGFGGPGIVLSDSGAAAIVTPTYWTVPAVSGGDETTDIDVVMLLTTSRA